MGAKIRRIRDCATGVIYPNAVEAGKAVSRNSWAVLSAIKRGGTCAGRYWAIVEDDP